jgi:hypothetical protein
VADAEDVDAAHMARTPGSIDPVGGATVLRRGRRR